MTPEHRARRTDEQAPPEGFADGGGTVVPEESLGERLLGSLLDRAHLVPPRLVGPLVAQELVRVGASDISIHLQDLDQMTLQPLSGRGLVGEPESIAGSSVGQAFATDSPVERDVIGGIRLHLPMLDGSDRVGVLSFTLPAVGEHDRRLAQRVAGLVADLVVTKNEYTDTFERVRATQELTLAAQLQRQSLPPLAMTTPDVSLAGMLEPAYSVGGDSFDYALNEHVLHLLVLDAMGHGLEAATMATVALAAYRHGRRQDLSLVDLYAAMDDAVATTFPGRFATAHLGELDTMTGRLSWVNAGHPPALWVREGAVIGELTGPVSRPLGLGSGQPPVQAQQLEQGDRLLFFTDGVVEERLGGGEQFGEKRLRELLEETTTAGLQPAESVRRLSHALMDARRGLTSDDASLLLVEWQSPPKDDELAPSP
ncbi:PP2C family protein-serine/threonine phosphatase [Blastococcus atacamensis]|uniref:PP2C family protein-serine/threonine phosphatase n=1 Tax=Blastococcus atacamensis TaxID=2070508 RepID=UPI000CEBA031|nr:PP2C family protein-serine/threonine phosphatase [Blastococcus atacamensis]